MEDGTATGTISDSGSQLLLVHAGHEEITPVVTKGAFKLWLEGGRVVKYAIELAGIVVRDGRTTQVHQVSFTLLMKVGATDVSAPNEVRQKLR